MITFDTDVLPLYGTNVSPEPEYAPTYATILGTVVFEDTTSDSGLSDQDGVNIQDGTIDEDVVFTDGGGGITVQQVVDDINGNSTVGGAGVVAELVEATGGYSVVIRKTTTADNSLTLADVVGGELVHLGLTTDTATGGGELEYDNIDQVSERRLLTMIEIMHAFMLTLDSRTGARLVHETLGNFMDAIPVGKVYDNLHVSVLGNIAAPVASYDAGTATVDVTTVSGTDNITLGAGPFASIQDVADDLNGSLSNVTEVEFYVKGGRLGVRNVSGSEGVAFTLAVGSANGILDVAGIEPGKFISIVEAVANEARDAAVTRFDLITRPSAL